MSANVNFNPMLTLTGSNNSFQLDSQGYIQGAFMDDPVSRMWVLPGIVASSNTQPFWGGLPIQENVPTMAGHTNGTLAGELVIPANAGDVTGFTLFNRAHNMIITPGNPVPVAAIGMNIAYARLGSNLRIPLPASSSLVSALEGGSIAQQVSWDFDTQELTTYVSGTNDPLPVKVLNVHGNSKIVSWDSSTNAVSWTYGYAVLVQI